MLEKKIPMVTFARIGGKDGMRMCRAAFAVMLKFSDLIEEFVALSDGVAMQLPLEDDATKEANIIKLIKDDPSSDILIKRWESAARMR